MSVLRFVINTTNLKDCKQVHLGQIVLHVLLT